MLRRILVLDACRDNPLPDDDAQDVSEALKPEAHGW
jgi:hypothetical protein